MTTPTTTATLPDEMVRRATQAVVQIHYGANGALAQQHGTTGYNLRREEAEASLTAAGVPQLLAEVERLRSGIASAMGLEGDLLDLYEQASDAERIEMLSDLIEEYEKSIKHYSETSLLNGRRAAKAERERDEAQEVKRRDRLQEDAIIK